jgi:hypothetical protein
MSKLWISERAVPGLGELHGLWYMILITTSVVCWNLLHWKAELSFPAARCQLGAHQATEWQELQDHQIGNSYSERNKRMSFRATEFQLWLSSFGFIVTFHSLVGMSLIGAPSILPQWHLIYPNLLDKNTYHFSHPNTTSLSLDLFTSWD